MLCSLTRGTHSKNLVILAITVSLEMAKVCFRKAPPIGQSYEPIPPKIELDRDLMVIHPHMKYEKDRTKTEGAREQTRVKFTHGRTHARTHGLTTDHGSAI